MNSGPVLRNLGITLVVVALLAAPGLLRRLIRRRRLEDSGTGAAGAVGAWQELIDSLVDLGLRTGGGGSPRAVEQVVAAHLGTAARPRAALERIRIAYERQAYSHSPTPIGADDVRLVVVSAGQRAGRIRRCMAAIAPRSLITAPIRQRLTPTRSAIAKPLQQLDGPPQR